MFGTLSADLRSAVRTLIHARGFTTIAVLTLGIGLALCISAFTVINAYLIRTLPYPAAERLYTVQYAAPRQAPPREMEALDWRSLDDIVEHQIAWDLDMFYLLGAAYPEAAPGAWVTPGFLHGLGIRSDLGRTIMPSDFAPGAPAVAVISHRLWQNRFGADPLIIGRQFSAYVSDRPDEPEIFTIVGVLANFWHVNSYADVLAPLKASTYPYMVRLHPGVPAAVASDRISRLVRASTGSLPDGWRANVISTHDAYVAELRPVLFTVASASALVLLIACANVAVLLLVRGNRRRHELAMRVALGASQAHIARILILEALVLGGAATAIGLTLSKYILGVAAPFAEAFLQRRVPGGPSAFSLDPVLTIGVIAVGVLITVSFALLPLLAADKTSLLPSLTSARASTDSRGPRRMRSLMVVVEIAASLTLLIASSLLMISAVRMLRVDLGIRTEGVLQASVTLRQRAYPDTASRVAFYERVVEALRAAAPNGSIALSNFWPLQPPRPRAVATDDDSITEGDAGVVAVSPGYFATVNIPVTDGRGFSSADRLGSEHVVVVSQSLARRLWPASRAVGQRLRVAAAPGAADSATAISHLVVGVVGDVRQSHLDANQLDAYLPLLQTAERHAFMFVYAPALPPNWEVAIRAAVASVDREVGMAPPQLLQNLLDQQRFRPQFLAAMLTTFAVSSALLAIIGLYGVLAYAARQREREIAVRMAVGADRQSITKMFLREGSVLLASGMITGVLGGISIGGLLRSQLHGVAPADPQIMGGTAFLFAAVGLAAMWWPARRAAAIDPARLLQVD